MSIKTKITFSEGLAKSKVNLFFNPFNNYLISRYIKWTRLKTKYKYSVKAKQRRRYRYNYSSFYGFKYLAKNLVSNHASTIFLVDCSDDVFTAKDTREDFFRSYDNNTVFFNKSVLLSNKLNTKASRHTIPLVSWDFLPNYECNMHFRCYLSSSIFGYYSTYKSL